MKVDIENSMDEFRIGLFKGKVNRFVSKVIVSMNPEELAQFLKFVELNNQQDSLLFQYDAFVPGGEDLGLGDILMRWALSELKKKGSYTCTFYSQTAADRESVQQEYVELWKQVKSTIESADTLAETTTKSIEL